VLHYSEVPP
jgi:hypothetical protein